MNEENTERTINAEQSSNQATTTTAPLDNLMVIRRPRPGSVVILAPLGTPVSVSGTEEYVKVTLLEIPSE